MMNDSLLSAVIAQFDFPGTLQTLSVIKSGHINSTYRLRYALEGGGHREYVLQRINDYVFKKPAEVMQNVRLITEHLSRAYTARGIDPANRVLHLVSTRDGGTMVVDEAGGCWRAYNFIHNAVTVDHVKGPDQFREIGSAFGEFQSMLADFPIHQLYETIPHFHDTVKRMSDFERSVVQDATGRAHAVAKEIEFIRSHGPDMSCIVEMIRDGLLPLRVTHNDTKINNVMLDVNTGKALCVIDLDTVMPGSALYDFGDAIRFGACTASEDETDLDRVSINIKLFTGFSEGFIAQTAGRLTRAELENLPLGAIVMTYENALRFLADHLDGDIYFRIERPGQNLDRARCQMRLLTDMEAKRGEMDAIVRRLIDRYN